MYSALISVHADPGAAIGAEGAGGQNVYVRELARELVARGHRIDVYTRSLTGKRLHVSRPWPGARVIRVPCGPPGYIGRDALFPLLPEFVRRVRGWARRHGVEYDVVHSNYWLSGWVARQLAEAWDVPQAHTSHSLGRVKLRAEGGVPTASDSTRLRVEDELAARAAVLASNEAEAASLRDLYGQASPAAIVPCGYDPTIFRPLDRAACRRALGLPAGVPIALYAGRFVPMKGVETLLQAASVLRLVHPLEVVLVGGCQPGGADEAERSRLVRLAARLGLGDSTRFAGAAAHERLAMYYAAANVVAVPSHYETFGMVAIEAMACGTPVVASAVGGLACSVVDGKTGLLAPPRDAPAFARAIARLLADPAWACRLGAAAAAHTRARYTWARAADCCERLYNRLLNAGRQEVR